jgi:transglutaminase/protease-like cytokinesis protein 3
MRPVRMQQLIGALRQLLLVGCGSAAFTTACSQERRTAHLDLTYEITSTGHTSRAVLTFIVPTTMPQVQEVIGIKYDPEPDSVFVQHGITYVQFRMDELDRTRWIKMDITVDIHEFDLETVKGRDPQVFDAAPMEEYLRSEKFLEKDSARIREMATRLHRNTRLKTIRHIYNYVLKEVLYTVYTNMDNGALNTLITKRSDCSGSADLFVALCRADQIPARVAYGFTTEYEDNPRHAWVEAFLDDLGWIRFDPTKHQALRFGKLRNQYIQLSSIRNDAVLDQGYFYAYRYWGDAIRVKESIGIAKTTPLP